VVFEMTLENVASVFNVRIKEIDVRLSNEKPLDDMEWREYVTTISIMHCACYLSDDDYMIYREKLKASWFLHE
jgi:hypothetical protein